MLVKLFDFFLPGKKGESIVQSQNTNKNIQAYRDKYDA